MVWCLWPVQPQRHVLHPRTTHREAKRYQVALLQGPKLLATSHRHDDPPPGLLLVLWTCKLSTFKRLCSTLEGRLLFYPLVSSHLAGHGSHPMNLSSNLVLLQSDCCCLITFSPLCELKSSHGEEDWLISVPEEILRLDLIWGQMHSGVSSHARSLWTFAAHIRN